MVAVVTGHWAWVVAILGLGLLIIVHEFGHFIAAKAFGMRVERFYMGFPPAAFSHTWGETEYGVGIIPLGGFCKISGMTPEEEAARSASAAERPSGRHRRDPTSTRKPIWQRNVAILAGPVMNFVAAVVILFLFVRLSGVPKATLTIAQVGRARRRPRPGCRSATGSSPPTARVHELGPGDVVLPARTRTRPST